MTVKINGKLYLVHRLVAETFLPNPDNKPYVDHISRNKEDNRAFENLRWVSSSQNCRNRRDNDRVAARGGTHWYEDAKRYYKEQGAKRNKTHKNVRFSDGTYRYIPNAEALILLAIPVNQRIFKG